MDVGVALRNTPKGRIKYDKYWAQEGRTKEVLDKISQYSSNVSLSVSPTILSLITTPDNIDGQSQKKTENIVTKVTPSKVEKNKKTFIQDAHFFELQVESESPLLEYEEDRMKYLEDAFECKKKLFDNFSNEVGQQIQQEYLLLKRQYELDSKRRLKELKSIENNILETAKEKEMQLREQYQSHVKKLSAKVLEAELKQKRAEEEIEKKQKEQTELRLDLSNCLQEAQSLLNKCTEKLNSCEFPEHLRVSSKDRVTEFTNLLNVISDLTKASELSFEDLYLAHSKVKLAYDIFQDVANDIESAKSKAAQSRGKSVSFSFKETDVQGNASTKDTGSLSTQNPQTTQTADQSSTAQSTSESKARKNMLATVIAPDMIAVRHKIMENFKQVEAKLQPLKTDPRNKKYRFELQKAVNVPINSLSSNSGSQIKTKINRLLAILSGQVPRLNGQDMSSDEAVYSFCSYLAAKQFVEQGDTQISSQHSTAFPIALAVVGVWCKKPDVGELILAHFYTRCPYLVPYYPPKEEGQTDQDFLETLGYRFDDDGNIEEKYKFLNRMTGYMRLYAAITISPLPPNHQGPHPHNISYAWQWLSRTLNLHPRPDITATLLYDLLQVTGHFLHRSYGAQFKKLLHVLVKDYFPRIRKATPGGGGGPVERLEIFLHNTMKKQQIPLPEGYLDSGFWGR